MSVYYGNKLVAGGASGGGGGTTTCNYNYSQLSGTVEDIVEGNNAAIGSMVETKLTNNNTAIVNSVNQKITDNNSNIQTIVSNNNSQISSIVSESVSTTIINSGAAYNGFYKNWKSIRESLQLWDTDNLPVVGSRLDFQSNLSVNWFDVVGYDVNVPEYVGYRRDGVTLYVRVWDDTNSTTKSVAVGDPTYYRSYAIHATYSTFTQTGNAVGAISGTFSYGNRKTFNVPATITVGGKAYAFCGHTMTVMSNQIVATSSFGSDRVWSSSTLRGLLNTNYGFSKEPTLFQNTLKSCNITYGGNTLDQFFIPSAVELGATTDSYLKDDVHSTFKMFGNKGLDNAFRTKGVAWWTRSQYISSSSGVWYVLADGGFKDYGIMSIQYGVVPACLIG